MAVKQLLVNYEFTAVMADDGSLLLNASDPGGGVRPLNFDVKRAQGATPDPDLRIVYVMRARTIVGNLPDLAIGELDIFFRAPAFEAAGNMAFDGVQLGIA